MNLAYWVGRSDTGLGPGKQKPWQTYKYLNSEMGGIFRIDQVGRFYIYRYHTGTYDSTGFDTVEEATSECERRARSEGYRILSEAETNLL